MQTLIKYFIRGLRGLALASVGLAFVMVGFCWLMGGWFFGVWVGDTYTWWGGSAIIFLWIATLGVLWDD